MSQSATGARPTNVNCSSPSRKRMPSPMTPPSGDTGTNCFAESTGNFAVLLMPVSVISFSASGPETKMLCM
jgi:hypothetical protein